MELDRTITEKQCPTKAALDKTNTENKLLSCRAVRTDKYLNFSYFPSGQILYPIILILSCPLARRHGWGTPRADLTARVSSHFHAVTKNLAGLSEGA